MSDTTRYALWILFWTGLVLGTVAYMMAEYGGLL